MGIFSKGRDRKDEREAEQAQLRWLTRLAREDLLELGERLEDEAPPAEPDALAERATARTLTAEARPRLRDAETTEAVLAVQETIGQAFVHLARSDAIVRGEEPPTRTDPCQFNPQHGPASTEVEWTPIGGEASTFKCCRPDADLIASGKAPRLRTIKVDGGADVTWDQLHSTHGPGGSSRAYESAGTYALMSVHLAQQKNLAQMTNYPPR